MSAGATIENIAPTMEQVASTMKQIETTMENIAATMEKIVQLSDPNNHPSLVRRQRSVLSPYYQDLIGRKDNSDVVSSYHTGEASQKNSFRDDIGTPSHLGESQKDYFGRYSEDDPIVFYPDADPVIFFPASSEGDPSDNQGVSGKSILEKAANGDFGDVLKLKELHQQGSLTFPIGRIMAALQKSTCERFKRKLIHWVAYYNRLEILEWVLRSSMGSSSISDSDYMPISNPGGPIWIKKSTLPRLNISSLETGDGDFLNAQDIYGCTALHLAVEENHEDIVKALLELNDLGRHDFWVDKYIAAQKMQNMPVLQGKKAKPNGLTPLHIACRNGSLSIVTMLLENVFGRYLEYMSSMIVAKSASGKTALHYAAESGDWEIVRCLLNILNTDSRGEYVNNSDILRQTPLYLAASNGHLDALEILLREGEGLKVNVVTWEGITALDIAKRNEDQPKEKEKKKFQRIVDMLESYDVNWLQSERQKYADAASFLLVGAVLIAGVAYASWLQPPLGLTQYYDLTTSNFAAPPQTFESYVGVEQHWEIQMFWVFNSMSFFCSVATFIVGAGAGIPSKCASLREEVVQLRMSVVRASFILAVAILFVMGAFASAGILVLPPIERQRAPTYVTVAVGASLCIILLMEFIRKLWIWFLSPSLQFKLKKDHSSEVFTDDKHFRRIKFNMKPVAQPLAGAYQNISYYV